MCCVEARSPTLPSTEHAWVEEMNIDKSPPKNYRMSAFGELVSNEQQLILTATEKKCQRTDQT